MNNVVPWRFIRRAAPSAPGPVGQQAGPRPDHGHAADPRCRGEVRGRRDRRRRTGRHRAADRRRPAGHHRLPRRGHRRPRAGRRVTEEYVRLLGRLSDAGLAARGRAEVSVKPTAVGLGLAEHGEKTALENIARIAAAARNAGTTVTLDMEDHTRIEPTLRLVGELRADFPDLGCVIQSYLRRSAGDCKALAARRLPRPAVQGCLPGAGGCRLAEPGRGGPSLRPVHADLAGGPRLPDARDPRSSADQDRRDRRPEWSDGMPAASSTRCCTASAR